MSFSTCMSLDPSIARWLHRMSIWYSHFKLSLFLLSNYMLLPMVLRTIFITTYTPTSRSSCIFSEFKWSLEATVYLLPLPYIFIKFLLFLLISLHNPHALHPRHVFLLLPCCHPNSTSSLSIFTRSLSIFFNINCLLSRLVSSRPGNSSRSFLEPEFMSEKFLPICGIFDIYKIQNKYKYIDVTQFLHRSVVFRYIKPWIINDGN